MKQNNLPAMLIIGLLTFVTVVSIGFYASRSQSQVSASSDTFQQGSVKSPAQPVNTPVTVQAGTETLSQVKNDITIKITSAKIISTGVEIGICYSTLDGGDWYPVPGHLFYSTYEIYPDEFEFTTEQKADGNNTGNRCALVRYRINDTENITAPIQFSVLNLLAHPREMPACQNFQERLDTNPKAKAYGLVAKCVETSDNGVSVTLVDQGASVTKEDAINTLNGIAKGEVSGPWVFTITDIK